MIKGMKRLAPEHLCHFSNLAYIFVVHILYRGVTSELMLMYFIVFLTLVPKLKKMYCIV